MRETQLELDFTPEWINFGSYACFWIDDGRLLQGHPFQILGKPDQFGFFKVVFSSKFSGAIAGHREELTSIFLDESDDIAPCSPLACPISSCKTSDVGKLKQN